MPVEGGSSIPGDLALLEEILAENFNLSSLTFHEQSRKY